MKKSITRDEWGTLILFLAILFGAFVRFNPASLAGFAVNDGGMFSVMVDDLRASHYLLPEFTTYNLSNIPFAYPPLGFYVGALAVDIFKVSSAETVRWMPAVFATLAIPAFYFLSLRLLRDKYLASLSTLFFALVPRAFFWMVMGGGLTRSLGQFFMLLALGVIVRLYEENRRRNIFLGGFLAALAVLSHPEAAVHTLISAIILWLIISRKQAAFVKSAIIGIVVLLLTSPWWLTVVRHHDLEPYLSAAQTGGNPLAIFHLVFFTFTQEPFMTVIAVFGLVGFVQRLIRRDYLLPLWVVIPFLVSGRSATNLVIVPLAMLAAVGLAEVVLPALQASVKRESIQPGSLSSIELGVFVYLLIYMILSSYQFGFQLSDAALHLPEREAMGWVRQNTRENSRFIVISGAASVACDSVSEWFPALSGRKSLFTVQGTEWTRGESLKPFIQEAVEIQECSQKGTACIDQLADSSSYDFVYLSKNIRTENCELLPAARSSQFLVEQLRRDPRYEIVYESDAVLVYRVR